MKEYQLLKTRSFIEIPELLVEEIPGNIIAFPHLI
jgi:hypothetical protein